MTEQTSSKVPQIRFSGFSRAWGRKSLGEVCAVGDADHWMPKTTSHGIPYVMTGDFYGINGIDFKNAKLISEADFEKLSRKIKPEHGDILFARYASIGSVRYINTTQKFIASYSCAILKCSKFFDGEYLFFLLQAKRCQDQLKSSTNTGSQGNVGIDSIKQLTAYFPEKSEQEKIAKFLSSINEMLEGLQRKHDKLVTLKKAMLQKMFPQAGASTPEIRFKGFAGEWVEKEFKLIALRSSQSCSEKGLPRIEYEDIVSGTGRLNKNLFKKISQKAGVKFAKGDVLFGKLRPYLRNWWLAEFDGIAVGDFWILTSAAAIPSFLYRLIQTEGFERIANQSAGSKMPRSDWKLVSNSLFRAPPDAIEQQKIGTYFCQLDEIISKQAIQLEKLKQLKAACLEKMFV